MLFARLKSWDEAAPQPPPLTVLVDPAAARAKLDTLTGRIEPREGQKAMAEAVTAGVRAQARQGFAQPAAGRGRDRDRQDPRLPRPGRAVGRGVGRDGLGLDLHQGAAAPARRGGPQTVRRRRRAEAEDRHPQGPRELSVPAQPRGRAAGRVRRPRRHSGAAGRALGGLHRGTATWSAATCPAGCRACSAAPDRPR